MDRRYKEVDILLNINSRQRSVNYDPKNYRIFTIAPSPINTTFMVSDQKTFFGREYVKVLAASSDQDTLIGWVALSSFLSVICGEPTWEILVTTSS